MIFHGNKRGIKYRGKTIPWGVIAKNVIIKRDSYYIIASCFSSEVIHYTKISGEKLFTIDDKIDVHVLEGFIIGSIGKILLKIRNRLSKDTYDQLRTRLSGYALGLLDEFVAGATFPMKFAGVPNTSMIIRKTANLPGPAGFLLDIFLEALYDRIMALAEE